MDVLLNVLMFFKKAVFESQVQAKHLLSSGSNII